MKLKSKKDFPREDLRDVNVIFVRSTIDDLGLSPIEFRIYAHLARRAGNGKCFPSISGIAQHCQIHSETVREAVQRLLAYNLISREERPGDTPLYTLTSAADWNTELIGKLPSKRHLREERNSNGKTIKNEGTPPEPPEGLLKGGGGERMEGYPPGTDGVHPPGTDGDEGYPLEVIQFKVIQKQASLGLSVKTPKREFDEGWCKRFKERFGYDYVYEGGKDGSAVKALLLANIPVPKLLEIAVSAWDLPEKDRFHREQCQTISGFRSQLNVVRNKVGSADEFVIPK